MTEGGSEGDPGPERVRSIAVHRDDVANALEATLRSDREVVLRATPPFSGRMRARLHAVDADGTGERTERAGDDEPPAPLHIDPRALVETVPAYPEVDDTAAEHPDADLEARRKRHAEAVEEWRERVRRGIGETVEIEVDGESRTVDVTALG